MFFDTKLSQILFLLIVISSLVLSACGDDPGDNIVLPTRYMISTKAPVIEPTETSAMEINSTLEMSETSIIVSATPEPTETAAITVTIAEILPFPAVDSGVTQTIADPLEGSFTNDYESLKAGESATVFGEIVVDVANSRVFILNDNQQRIIVLIEPTMVNEINGHQVSISGLVQNSVVGADTLFAITPERFIDLQIDDIPSVDILAPRIPDADALPSLAAQIGTLDMNLGINLTALEVYDQLVVALGDVLGNVVWVELVGSKLEGWTVVFLDVENDVTFSYVIDPVGNVEALGAQPATPFYMNAVELIRHDIVVDSEHVIQSIPTVNQPFPLEGAILSLTATSDGGFAWVIRGLNTDPIDATISGDND